LARKLLRRCGKGALATIDRDDGKPYASLVVFAVMADASPVMLLSDLADHTANLKRDDSVSLMLDGMEPGSESMTGLRITVQGRISIEEDPAAKTRIVARHPEASIYADFGDFSAYRIIPERVHLIGGFGFIHWLDAVDVFVEAPKLDATANEIIDHMNEDHTDAVTSYAKAAGMAGKDWCMIGIDTDGCDLSNGERYCRVDTKNRMITSGDARRELAALAKAIHD
jgi:putative heme iron utilization protein